jgi:hypothetical protein
MKKKPVQVKTGTYQHAGDLIAQSIGEISHLLQDAQKNHDLVAVWTLGFIYDDLIKNHTRLGNVRLTIKGNQT